MTHLSISLDEDMQHTFSFFEKVQARRGGLNILASQDAAFRCFIESFPRILLLSLNNHISSILDILQNIGIPADRIPNIILAFPPILLWNVELLQTRVLALNQVRQIFLSFRTKCIVMFIGFHSSLPENCIFGAMLFSLNYRR
jgi:mTERF domain-containing protein, mitochondrial